MDHLFPKIIYSEKSTLIQTLLFVSPLNTTLDLQFRSREPDIDIYVSDKNITFLGKNRMRVVVMLGACSLKRNNA